MSDLSDREKDYYIEQMNARAWSVKLDQPYPLNEAVLRNTETKLGITDELWVEVWRNLVTQTPSLLTDEVEREAVVADLPALVEQAAAERRAEAAALEHSMSDLVTSVLATDDARHPSPESLLRQAAVGMVEVEQNGTQEDSRLVALRLARTRLIEADNDERELAKERDAAMEALHKTWHPDLAREFDKAWGKWKTIDDRRRKIRNEVEMIRRSFMPD